MTDAPLVEPSPGQTVPKHTHGGLFLAWVLILMTIFILTIILTTHIVTIRKRLDDQEAAFAPGPRQAQVILGGVSVQMAAKGMK